jgi:hypothetical protein
VIHLLHLWFGYPDGSVLTNLVASGLWFVPGFLYGRYHAKKFHAKLDELHKRVKKND